MGDLDLPSHELMSIGNTARITNGKVYTIGMTSSGKSKFPFAVTERLVKPVGARQLEKVLRKAMAVIGKTRKFKNLDGCSFMQKLDKAMGDARRSTFLPPTFRFNS